MKERALENAIESTNKDVDDYLTKSILNMKDLVDIIK